MAPLVMEFEYAMYVDGSARPATLWLQHDVAGDQRLVNYRSWVPGQPLSDWHGTFTFYPDLGALRLHFNYRGVLPHHWCELFRTFRPHVFIGCDYKYRFIRLTFRRSWRYMYSTERFISSALHLRDALAERAIMLPEEREWVLVCAPEMAQVPDESGDESQSTGTTASEAMLGIGVWL